MSASGDEGAHRAAAVAASAESGVKGDGVGDPEATSSARKDRDLSTQVDTTNPPQSQVTAGSRGALPKTSNAINSGSNADDTLPRERLMSTTQPVSSAACASGVVSDAFGINSARVTDEAGPSSPRTTGDAGATVTSSGRNDGADAFIDVDKFEVDDSADAKNDVRFQTSSTE